MNDVNLENGFDRRAFERVHRNRGGLLCAPGVKELSRYTMRNSSERGIGLRLQPNCRPLIAKFLTVEEGFWVVRECRLVWRKGDFVGAEFIDRKRPRTQIAIRREA
jgi:hypothetical protein